MLDACILTIVRDGDDYLEPSIKVIAPHVKRVRIAVDSRSIDTTFEVAIRLQNEFPHIEVSQFTVMEPIIDLVRMRNSQLGFPEKFGFIVDSDEYHQDIAQYVLQDHDAYAFRSFSLWSRETMHKASNRAIIGRIFKNSPTLQWKGRFGKEVLYDGQRRVFQTSELLPWLYTHFTHIKKDDWRLELKQVRVADDRDLAPTPERIIHLVDKIHENMQGVRWRKVSSRSKHGETTSGKLTHRGPSAERPSISAQGGVV